MNAEAVAQRSSIQEIGSRSHSLEGSGRERVRILPILVASLLILAGGSISIRRELDRAKSSGISWKRHQGEAVVTAVEARVRGDVRVGDRVLAIDGRPVLEIARLGPVLSDRGESPIRLLVLRAGVPVPVDLVPAPVRPDWRFLFLALVGAATLAIGVETIRRAGHEPGLRLFGWSATALAGVMLLSPIGRYDTTNRIIFALEELCRLAVPPLLVHFALRAPAGRRRLGASAAPLYFPALLVLLGELDLYLLGGRHLPFSPEAAVALFDRLFFVHLAAAACVAIGLWSIRLARATGETARRLRWLLAGVAGALLPVAVLSGFAHVLGPEWSFFATLSLPSLVLLPLGAAAALVRFRLEEVDRVVARSTAAAATLLVALLVFGGANFLFERALPFLGEPPRHLASFTAGFGSLVLLAPARRRISDWILRAQHSAGERERTALVELAREMSVRQDPASLGDALLEALVRAVPLERANLFVPDGEGFSRLRFDPALPDRIPGDCAPATAPIPPSFERYAMVSRGRLAGLLVVRGLDGLPTASEDRALLEALAAQAAVAFDNARLYFDLAREADRVRQLAEFNERVLESSGSGIAVLDRDGRVLAANSRLASWVGRGRHELIGERLADLFPPAAEEGAGERAGTFFTPGSSAPRRFELRREPLSGVPGATVLVASDVTEADSLRRELAARERLAAVGLVAASVAHEVNTPLAGISSYAQMLLEETPLADPRHEMLEKIERQTFRAASLVRDVLDLARGGEVERHPIDLREVVREALTSAEAALAGVAVRCRLPETAVEATGDGPRLARAVVNILRNAKDAAPHGTVTVSASSDATAAAIEVIDDGRGMTPEERARAFEPLYSTKGKAGNGLGLALAAEVVRAHGGRIELAEGPGGRGTRVRLSIPRGRSA